MRRSPGPSPPALADKLLDRHIQGMAVGEPFEALDRFAPAIGAGAPDRHEAGDRTPMPGDREPFAPSNPFEQRGEMSLRLICANFLRHGLLSIGLRLV